MVPASTTMVSFSKVTFLRARSMRTRATQASHVGIVRSWPKVVAMPRPVSFGIVLPQPAFCAARFDDRGLPQCAADGVRSRARIPAGTIKQPEAECDRVGARRVSRLVHEA